jgi:hypothetical protein
MFLSVWWMHTLSKRIWAMRPSMCTGRSRWSHVDAVHDEIHLGNAWACMRAACPKVSTVSRRRPPAQRAAGRWSRLDAVTYAATSKCTWATRRPTPRVGTTSCGTRSGAPPQNLPKPQRRPELQCKHSSALPRTTTRVTWDIFLADNLKYLWSRP